MEFKNRQIVLSLYPILLEMKQIFISGVVFALLSSCVSNAKIGNEQGENNLIPFIEFYSVTEGKALSGTPYPGRRIDSPGYSYDSNTQKLDIYRYKIPDTLSIKLYLGVGKVLKGTAGQGVSSTVIGVNELPFTYNDFTITNATNNEANCYFRDKHIALKPNQEYFITETKIDSLPNATVLQTTTTWKVTFTGFVKK